MQECDDIRNNTFFYDVKSSDIVLFNYKSFFEIQNTQPDIYFKKYKKIKSDGVFLLVLLSVFSLFYLRTIGLKSLSSVINIYLNINSIRKGEIGRSVFSLTPFLIFGFNFLLMINIFFGVFIMQSFSFIELFKFNSVFIIFLLAKYMLYNLTGYIFNFFNDVKIVVNYYINYIFFIGILLIPIILLGIYFDFSNIIVVESIRSKIIIGIMCMAYVYVMFAVVQYAKKNNLASLFHIILYLCTFEILPVLLIGKFLMINKFFES